MPGSEPDLLSAANDELRQVLVFAIRQKSELFTQRRSIPWWKDTRPETLADALVKQLHTAGFRVFRTPPREAHRTTGGTPGL